MQILVAGIRRAVRHGHGHRGDKIRTLEGRLRSVGLHKRIRADIPRWRHTPSNGPDSFPGKRESRRFKGLYTITQQDIIEQRQHYDAVAYGGWAIDLHPSDGVYAPGKACNQWHSKGVYQIPYRCYVTPDLDNLFIGGRIISTSHVAQRLHQGDVYCGPRRVK